MNVVVPRAQLSALARAPTVLAAPPQDAADAELQAVALQTGFATLSADTVALAVARCRTAQTPPASSGVEPMLAAHAAPIPARAHVPSDALLTRVAALAAPHLEAKHIGRDLLDDPAIGALIGRASESGATPAGLLQQLLEQVRAAVDAGELSTQVVNALAVLTKASALPEEVMTPVLTALPPDAADDEEAGLVARTCGVALSHASPAVRAAAATATEHAVRSALRRLNGDIPEVSPGRTAAVLALVQTLGHTAASAEAWQAIPALAEIAWPRNLPLTRDAVDALLEVAAQFSAQLAQRFPQPSLAPATHRRAYEEAVALTARLAAEPRASEITFTLAEEGARGDAAMQAESAAYFEALATNIPPAPRRGEDRRLFEPTASVSAVLGRLFDRLVHQGRPNEAYSLQQLAKQQQLPGPTLALVAHALRSTAAAGQIEADVLQFEGQSTGLPATLTNALKGLDDARLPSFWKTIADLPLGPRLREQLWLAARDRCGAIGGTFTLHDAPAAFLLQCQVTAHAETVDLKYLTGDVVARLLVPLVPTDVQQVVQELGAVSAEPRLAPECRLYVERLGALAEGRAALAQALKTMGPAINRGDVALHLCAHADERERARLLPDLLFTTGAEPTSLRYAAALLSTHEQAVVSPAGPALHVLRRAPAPTRPMSSQVLAVAIAAHAAVIRMRAADASGCDAVANAALDAAAPHAATALLVEPLVELPAAFSGTSADAPRAVSARRRRPNALHFDDGTSP